LTNISTPDLHSSAIWKHFYRLIFFAMLALFSFEILAANDIDNIRFPEKNWDGQVLNILIKGPAYLDKNKEYDIPEPSANSSEVTQHELALLRKYAAEARSQEQVSKILTEAQPGEFSEIYLDEGPINPELKKLCYRILKFADKEIVYFVVNYKKRFSRPRPSQLAPQLDLVVPNPGHAAYPSGHATQSMVFSLILAMIDPENEATYLEYARNIAKRREIAGVHYPSDSQSGQLLAEKLVQELIKVPEFITMLNETQERFKDVKQ